LTLLTGTILAETYGVNVLIVDADLETPGIYPYLNENQRKELKEGNIASLLDSYRLGRVRGRIAEASWIEGCRREGGCLYLFPTTVDPGEVSRFAYVLGLGRSTGRRTAASVMGRLIREAAESVGARVVLLDAGPGLDNFTRMILGDLADAVVLLSRADGASLMRVRDALLELAGTGDLRLKGEKPYEFSLFVFTSIPINHNGDGETTNNECKKPWISRETKMKLDKIYYELRRRLYERAPRLPEAYFTVPLTPQMLSPLLENPVEYAWRQRRRWPLCLLVGSVDRIARIIAGRVL